MKKNIQQFISLTLGLKFILTSFTFISPTKVDAQLATADIKTELETGFTALAAGASAASQSALQIEQTTIKDIAISIAKQILQQLTLSIVNWINSGFNGSPAFVTNPSQYFQNLADGIAGNFLQSNGALSSLCSPFSLDVRIALARKQSGNLQQGRYTCTLSGAIKNAKNAAQNASQNGFIHGDFSQGGWDAFAALTGDPQNNAGGAYLEAQGDLGSQISSASNQKTNELNQGNGFLSKESCTYTATNNQTGQVSSVSPDAYNANAGISAYGQNNGGVTYKQNCTTQTPGSVTAGVLQKSLGVPTDELLVANDLNAIITAAFSQLSYQVLNLGLSSISNSKSGSSAGQAYLTTLANQSGNSLKQLQKNTLASLAPYVSTIQQLKVNIDNTLAVVTTTKNDLNAGITCWAQFGSDATAQNQTGQLQQALTSVVAPLFVAISTEDDTASTTLATLLGIESSISAAQNNTDLNLAGQELQNLTSTTALPTKADVATAAQETKTTTAAMKPLDRLAQSSLQQCQQLAPPTATSTSTH